MPLLLLWALPASSQLPHVYDLTWFAAVTDDQAGGGGGETAYSSELLRGAITTSAGVDAFEGSTHVEQSDRRTLTIMQELTAACKQNQSCSKKPTPFDRIACIRKCVTPHCYSLVYADDPVEPGEIDVKYDSYKQCFHNYWKNLYPLTYNDLLM